MPELLGQTILLKGSRFSEEVQSFAHVKNLEN